MRQRIITSFLLLLTCTLLSAQNLIARKRIDSSRGLSNNFVLCLTIDGHGFVWVGTESGLNRLDGGTCFTFYNDDSDPAGFKGNKVETLYYDKATDQMIIGSGRGLNIYDCKKGTFRGETTGDSLVFYVIEDIIPDNKQGAWLIYANGQIQHLDCKTHRVKTLHVKNPKGNRCGLDDGKGHLYIGHDKYGMSILNSETGEVIRSYAHEKDNASSIPGNNVRRIYQDSGGRIWVGTDHGMALYNPTDGTFHKVVHQNDHRDDNVYDIREMSDRRLWVACDVGGISILQLSGIDPDKPMHYVDDAKVELTSFNTRCIFQDSYDNIWVGNHSTGLDFIPSKQEFMHNLPYYDLRNRMKRTYAVTSDQQGRLWVSGEDELSVWNGNQMEGEWKVDAMICRSHSFARSMMADDNGYIWMGMEDEGVIRFNTHTKSFERIDIGYNAPDIHSFMADTDGRVWIGSEFGVCVYDKGNVTHHEAIDRLTHKAPVSSFIRLSADEIIIVTQGFGVLKFNERTQSHQLLTMRDGLPTNNFVHAIYNKYKGLWLATNEGIVHIPSPANNLKEFETFNTTNGLIDNHAQAIHQDSEGRIWVSTYRGISCLDTDKKQFYNYNQQDGIQIGSFFAGAVGSTARGDIAFSSPNGVCYFDPLEPDNQTESAHPRISSCRIYKSAEEPTGTISIMPDEDGNIHLSYHQNTIRIVVAVDNYAQIGNVDYSYMMKGMDDKWYDIGSDQDVVFHRLRPGHYTFILRAKLRNQNWEQAQQTEMEIFVSPPFWRTWWAYALYAIALISLGWLFVRSYKHRLILRNSLELERRESLQKQELNEERLRFFTNITHELRTPLTLILGPLEDLRDDKQLSQANKRRVTIIQKSAEQLRNLISEILEFRKTETQNRHLTVARGDLAKFVHEICINYKELNRNPNVQFVYNVAPNLPHVYFDSEVINTILNNLLSNAVKYTEKGSITVNLNSDGDDTMVLSVSDTGYGIAPNALPHIFERYYQAKGSHQASGTGIGLALVKALADLHQARLDVESREHEGSRFTLSLSISNTYPNALHKEDVETVEPVTSTDVAANIEESLDEQMATLLIVEDNADIGQYIADSFCDDFRILRASNGVEGKQLAEEHMPDIIVSDIMMPKMNGIDLTRQLKEDIRTSHIPIILLTAKSTDEDKETGYESGADSYLTKPFTAKLLGSRIQNLLMARRRLAEYIINHPSENEETTAVETPTLSRLDREFLEHLNQIIHENIMTENLDLPFITDKMAMSHSTFYRKVKALTGMTAKEYIRKFRLQHCYKLLESGDYNVNEAASMTGFNQMSHFRETFKKEFGILPSEVKRAKT
ncbi:MAG: response regulator [Prevotella sp.]|nr:response regulator [Prevotella sp.]